MDESKPNTAFSYRPFIPAALDDYGLNSSEFRVLCHLYRRAGKDRRCYPAAHSIAKTCKLHRDTVWVCIKKLENLGLLQRRKGRRNSNEYTLTEIRVGENKGPTEANELAETKGQELTGSDGRLSAETEGCKGYPIEGHPKKNIQRGISKDSGETKEANGRDPVLNALTAIDGSDLTQVTRPAWDSAATALSDIRTVCPNVTRELLHLRAVHFTQRFPNAKISPRALAKHWAACERPPRSASAARELIHYTPLRNSCESIIDHS